MLAVVLLLVPVAAMAADLGSAYVADGDLQQVADVAARAGAEQLAIDQRDTTTPGATMTKARTAAVQALCAGVRAPHPWAPACDSTGWAADGDRTNGEISFYAGTPDAEKGFTAGQAGSDAQAGPVTGIRVVAPPLRVEFGLAAVFTADHTTLQRAATAGIFTVLPRYGFCPMYLAAGEHGGFCTRSAPQSIWQPTHPACPPPTGLPDKTVARGYLTAPRTKSSENTTATTWNTATGFDRDHQPLPGSTATLAPNSSYSAYSSVSALVRDLSNGLFVGTGSGGAPARLKGGTCRGAYSTTSGANSSLESAYLTDFLDPSIGDKATFRDAIRSPAALPAGQRGWLDPSVLRCGRLAVVPVLSTITNPPPANGLTTLTYPVTDLRLVWLDDRLWETEPSTERVATGSCLERGFYWADPYLSSVCRNDLRAYTGYVLDPRLLPATVADTDATNALDRFVGSGLPATVRLLRDVADPPPR